MRYKVNQDSILIVAFLIMIVTPAIIMFLSPVAEISETENRVLATLPSFEEAKDDLSGYLHDLATFGQDHFGFRELLVEMNSWVNYFVFGASTDPRVIIGKDGWLFINSNNGGIISIDDYYRGVLPPLTDAQLEAYRLRLEARRDRLAAQGIQYYFVVTPDKHTIYNQYMPDAYTPVSDKTWLDQVIGYLQEHSDVVIIDMREELQAAVEANPEIYYYYPLGTHWTGEGAWIGYEIIMQRLQQDFPDLTQVNKNDFVAPNRSGDADLATFLNLSNWLTTFVPSYHIPIKACAESIETDELNQLWMVPQRLNGLELQYYQCETAPNPQRVLFFRDSYTLGLSPYFAETFATTAFIWAKYSDDLMMRVRVDVQPDIVIEQAVEREMIYTIIRSP